MAMKLSTALIAGLPQRELNAVIDSGCVSKSDQRVITALRAGDHTGAAAKRRVFEAVKKKFAAAEMLKRGIYEYARQRFEEETEMRLPMGDIHRGKYFSKRRAPYLYVKKAGAGSASVPIGPDETEESVVDLLEERVSKARSTQAMLGDAIKKYQAARPGCNRADAIDKILFSPVVSQMVELEHRIDKLGAGGLPQHRATTDIDFSQPGTRGRIGYDASVADTHPQHQDAGEEPTIHDHNQLLADIASGKIPFSDPRVSALVRLERKRVFGG
jgi:hypothetical protein